MSERRAQVEELLADYRRSRERLATARRELASLTASATDPDELITVTVGPHGALTGLVLADGAYQRYRPAELAEHIVRAAAKATAHAFGQAADALAPALPAGTDPRALLLGDEDLAATESAPPQRAGAENDGFTEQSELREQTR